MTPDQHAAEAERLLKAVVKDYNVDDPDKQVAAGLILQRAHVHALLSTRKAPPPAAPPLHTRPPGARPLPQPRPARPASDVPQVGKPIVPPPDRTPENAPGRAPTDKVGGYPDDEPFGFDGYPDDGIAQR